MTFFNSAASRFRLFGGSSFNIPKPKFQYYINFVTNNLTQHNQQQLSYFVKRMDRLQMSYAVTEMNQYNKKRLVQGKMEFNPISFTFYDTIDSSAVKLIEAYNRFYYDDFLSKNDNSWDYDIIGNNFESNRGWGLAGRLSANNNYFIERIEIYEIYNQYYSQISFINPKFTNVDMANLSVEDGNGNEITIATRFEGVVFDAITEPVTQQLANMFGLPFHNDLFTSLGNGLNISGPDLTSGVTLPSDQTTLTTLANILNNQVSGGLISPAFNLVNNILNSGLGEINGIYGTPIGGAVPGDMSINKLQISAQDIPSVEAALNAGNPSRDVTTGNFDLNQNNFSADSSEA